MKFAVMLMIVFLAFSCWGEVKFTRLDLVNDAKSKDAYFAQPVRLWGTGKFMDGKENKVSLLTLSNTKTSFLFTLSGQATDDGKWQEAMLGMRAPSGANWYSSGFFKFNIDKTDSKDCQVEIVDSNNEGSFILRYTAAKVKADLKITLLDDDDKLLMEFTPNAEAPIERAYLIELLCYPSSLGGGFAAGQELRKREALTPTGILQEGSHKLTNKDYWILFYDNYFDVGENRGEGPCAVLCSPKEAIRIDAIVSNYPCYAKYWYPMNRKAFLILWDFKGWSNQAAKDLLKQLEVNF